MHYRRVSARVRGIMGLLQHCKAAEGGAEQPGGGGLPSRAALCVISLTT